MRAAGGFPTFGSVRLRRHTRPSAFSLGNTAVKTLYRTTATAWGGRLGHVESADGRLTADLSMPADIGGDDGPGTNPEQLFAAGYAACFHNALRTVARRRRVDVTDSAVSVTIGLLGGGEDGFHLAATIEAEIPGVDDALGQELLEAAHERCPYSRATRGNIPAEIRLVSSE